MSSGCSGVVNDYVYSVAPNVTGSFSITTHSTTGSTVTKPCQLSFPNLRYSACTVIPSPPSVVIVGTTANGAQAFFAPINDNGCQKLSGLSLLDNIIQPVSVVPTTCSSQQSPFIPCVAVLGTIAVNPPQYIIQYTVAGTTKKSLFSNPYSETNGTHPPILALKPSQPGTLYILGYPTKNSLTIKLNTPAWQPSSSIASSPSNSISSYRSISSSRELTSEFNVHRNRARAIPSPPSNGFGAGNLEGFGGGDPSANGETVYPLSSSVDASGPAVIAGNNIVVASKNTFLVDVISLALDSQQTYNVLTSDLTPPSSIVGSGNLVGIDSLAPDESHGNSTVWFNYVATDGYTVIASSSQPALFSSSPTNSTGGNNETSISYPEDARKDALTTGEIVGIAVGCAVGGILLVLLCYWAHRSRKRRQCNNRHLQQQMTIGKDVDGVDVSVLERHFSTEKLAPPTATYRSVPFKEDHSVSNTRLPSNNIVKHSDIASPTVTVSALANLTRPINNASSQDDDLYLPTSNSNNSTMLNGSFYTLLAEPPMYAPFPKGYAIRSATRIDPTNSQQTLCTIHYFPADCATWFAKALQATVDLQCACEENSHKNRQGDYNDTRSGLVTLDAFVLSEPTRQGNYQYLWITTPFSLQQTLHHLLLDGSSHIVVDTTQFSFKAWSTLSMLKALDQLHRRGWVHGKLNTFSYFYTQASTVTDWYLTGLYQSRRYDSQLDRHRGLGTENGNLGDGYDLIDMQLDEWSAPELLTNVDYRNSKILNYQPRRRQNQCQLAPSYTSPPYLVLSQPSTDIWSLGCVLYTVATGKMIFQHMHDYQSIIQSQQLQSKLNAILDEVALVDETFKELLQRMLEVDPARRDNLPNLIHFWTGANNLDEDDDNDDDE